MNGGVDTSQVWILQTHAPLNITKHSIEFSLVTQLKTKTIKENGLVMFLLVLKERLNLKGRTRRISPVLQKGSAENMLTQ